MNQSDLQPNDEMSFFVVKSEYCKYGIFFRVGQDPG